jgi:hypothetical protein
MTITMLTSGPDGECDLTQKWAPRHALCIIPAEQEYGPELVKTSQAEQETLTQLRPISIEYNQAFRNLGVGESTVRFIVLM